MNTSSILHLYQNAMANDMVLYNVSNEQIKVGIEAMAHVYKPDTVSLSSSVSMIADYNDVAHRCAYLHKYAAFHTAMVRDMLFEAVEFNFDFFNNWLRNENTFKICSLGGGPGSDIIGCISALHRAFSLFPSEVAVIDYMFDWSYSFDSILRELGSGWYGGFGEYMCFQLNSRYIAANLLKTLTPEVMDVLSQASLVTMIKFASAAACQGTDFMLKNVFAAMKPGALLLFIDNDGGGYHQVFMDAVRELNFISVYGPCRHKEYTNTMLKLKQFGHFSCYKTTVTVHIVQKPPLQYPHYDPLCYSPSPFLESGRPSLLRRHSPILISPPTPFLFQPNLDFTKDERTCHNDFISPSFEIPQSPQNFASRHLDTPAGKRNFKRKHRQGCFPVHFRHHIAERFHNVKARARSLLKRKKKRQLSSYF